MGTSSSLSAGEVAAARGEDLPGGGSDMQTRNENLIIADLVRSTRHARHLGTTAGKAGPRKRLGGHHGGIQEDGSNRSRCTIHTVQGSSGVCSARGGGHINLARVGVTNSRGG
jgi:hypothetical protein